MVGGRKISHDFGGKVYHTICQVLSGKMNAVNWSAFTDDEWRLMGVMARTEGVGPLLYWHFRDAGWPARLPGSLRTNLALSYYHTAAHNTLLYQELAHILDLLAGGNIPVIVLKGAALAATIYPEVALRPMGDVDLLVPRQQFDAAVRIARWAGYVEAYPEMAPGVNQQIGHHVHMRSSTNQLMALELHWGLAAGDGYWYAVPVAWFWEQTEHWGPETRFLRETGFLEGKDVLILTPAAQLLHLAAHAMLQHGGGRIVLRWVYDVDRLIRARSADLDWQVLCSRARAFRWTPALYAALSRAQACFGTPVPDGLMQTLEKDGDRRVLSLVERKAHFPGTRAASTWQALASLNWPARLRLAAAFIFPAPTYVRWRYNPRPAWSWPVYYLYRWLDMLGDGIVTLGKAPPAPQFWGE